MLIYSGKEFEGEGFCFLVIWKNGIRGGIVVGLYGAEGPSFDW